MKKLDATLKVAVMCGGPSLERGISLNSARSAMDHLESETLEIVPIYFDTKKRAYKISKAQLYSNNPSDFDFKLKQTATPLSQKALVDLLKSTDLAFPIMHGPFGEDGQIQRMLERYNIPFVGSSSETCKKAFDKFIANEFIKQHGFFTLPSVVLKIYHTDHRHILEQFFKEHDIKRAVVKPASGGSSIGVFSVTTVDEALEKADLLFSKRMDTRVVVEPFAQGTEFTVIILENRFGLPVALPPTEIITDYTKNQIFDFRKKYLPTGQVTWHCPPRFDDKMIERIQIQAEQLFALFGMRGFARFDGWILPDGNIWFSDFNPISGMEQNSFLFQQASRIDMTHRDILYHIIEQSCRRYNIPLPAPKQDLQTDKKTINVLMGGGTAERQVSLMSGTNAWLKLRRSSKYRPQPYLLTPNDEVWHLPYHLCLNHTTDEIVHNCQIYQEAKNRLTAFEEHARLRLGLLGPKNSDDFFEPRRMTLSEFIAQSNFVFIGLHGGMGEDGTLQKQLTQAGVAFNGPDEHVSRLCMDKWATANAIRDLAIPGVAAIPGSTINTAELLTYNEEEVDAYWKKLKHDLDTQSCIVKPRADGCSTGIVRLHAASDLKTYAELLAKGVTCVPKNTFRGQPNFVEMPTQLPQQLVFEKFIETDTLRVKANRLQHAPRTGLIEITIGVIERNGQVMALDPSITVAEGAVLSVEEKFQGGTGINITPPPAQVMAPKVRQKVKERVTQLAQALGIRGYSRIDAFVDILSGDLLIIEINSLPALTPSTVLYHQALAQERPLFPPELVEILVENKEPVDQKRGLALAEKPA